MCTVSLATFINNKVHAVSGSQSVTSGWCENYSSARFVNEKKISNHCKLSIRGNPDGLRRNNIHARVYEWQIVEDKRQSTASIEMQV